MFVKKQCDELAVYSFGKTKELKAVNNVSGLLNVMLSFVTDRMRLRLCLEEKTHIIAQ